MDLDSTEAFLGVPDASLKSGNGLVSLFLWLPQWKVMRWQMSQDVSTIRTSSRRSQPDTKQHFALSKILIMSADVAGQG